MLPFSVFLLLVCSALFFFSVNSGQLVVEKTRLTNAADAAAYSAGVVHARALNYGAYTNRAIVANEIAVAQTVSLVSWTDYFTNLLHDGPRENAAGELAATMPVRGGDWQRATQLAAVFAGSFIGDYYSGGSLSDFLEYFAQAVNAGGGVIVTASSAAAHVLSASQVLLYAQFAAGMVIGETPVAAIASDVVRAMDPAMEVQIVPTSFTALNFVRRYQDDERSRLLDVVNRSLDGFTVGRNWDIRSVVPLFHRRIERRGGTSMSSDYESWTASDDLTARWRFFRRLRWRQASESLAGSNVTANNGSSSSSSRIENYDDEFSSAIYLGMPGFFELRDLDATDTTTAISILVEKPRGALLTSGNAARASPTGRLDLYRGAPAGDRIAALSRVEVYFERPTPRADGRDEIGSLFNPYWQVRLVTPTALDRAFAALRQGLP